MEHQTMSLLSWFNFKVVAHELAHQWFGNHVTCETLNDVWINEGLRPTQNILHMSIYKHQP